MSATKPVDNTPQTKSRVERLPDGSKETNYVLEWEEGSVVAGWEEQVSIYFINQAGREPLTGKS